ncbi:hypothetical protein X943_000544 [Babesia divergens]|uniref:Uncharacterized protein n=1 Tax=Babesia divergens TaxID=32595 RepID=A0AAD9GF73_BABDI|nr:hypothetical protein X943_000544 [Babesia divergens]
MGNLPRSAAYFSRTPEVDEFLSEFIRVRNWYITHLGKAVEDRGSERPYRRSNKRKIANSTDSKRNPDDDLLAVAKEMSEGDAIHLDAFIALVVSYDDLLNELDRKACNNLKPKSFELYKIMKDATIKERKASLPPQDDDLKSALREAEEKRYQRLVADVREQLQDKATRVAGMKPPIIGGLNAFFGVALTFVGAFSIAGALGVKDNVKKAIIGIIASFMALLVDTLLFLMRSGR